MHTSVSKNVISVVRSDPSTQPLALRKSKAPISSHRLLEKYNRLGEKMTGESTNSSWRTSYTFLVHLETSSVLQLLLMELTTMRALGFIRSGRHQFLNVTKKHLYDILEIPSHVSLNWNLRAVLRHLQTSFPSSLTIFNPTTECIATNLP